jgi:hypothetical protein
VDDETGMELPGGGIDLDFTEEFELDGLSFIEGAVHWLYGHGEDINIPFDSVDPGWGGAKIDPCGFDEGVHQINMPFLYELLFDPRIGNGGPGTINIDMVGTLYVERTSANWDYGEEGMLEWRFDGRISARDDFNDFDKKLPPRDPIWKEHVTTYIRENMRGVDFWTRINGFRSIHSRGTCGCK